VPRTLAFGDAVKRRVYLVLAGALSIAITLSIHSLRYNDRYKATDPVLVGATGRPQLVEFFHHA
jgi:hypothetical protein